MHVRARRARGRGVRRVGNADLREETGRLQALLEAMEVGRQQEHEAGDISEPEEEVEEETTSPC